MNNKAEIPYASQAYWEATCGEDGFWGNTLGTRWKAWTKLRYKKYYSLLQDEISSRQPKRILDIGCSDGDFLHYLHGKNKKNELWGVDIAHSAIQALNRRFPLIKTKVGSLNELEGLPTAYFDIIFCVGTLSVLNKEHYSVAFNGIGRLIREDGYFLMEYPNNLSSDKERIMLNSLRKAFYIHVCDFEYGAWYIDLFQGLWNESFRLEHPNIFLWVATLIILGNYPLAVICEYITKKLGYGRSGISGKIMVCKKRIKNS